MKLNYTNNFQSDIMADEKPTSAPIDWKVPKDMFAEIKMQIGSIMMDKIKMSSNGNAIECNPATHRITEHVCKLLEECFKKWHGTPSAPNLPGKYYVEVDASVIKEAARHLYFIHNNAYPDPENYVQDRIYNGFVKDLTAVIPFILQKLTPVATPAPINNLTKEQEILLSLIRCVLCIEINNAISHQIQRLYKYYAEFGSKKAFDSLHELLNPSHPEWKGEIVRSDNAATTQNNLREGVESAEEIYKAIEDRITHFNNVHHKFEAKELSQALSTIKRLVPPSQFTAPTGLQM